MLFPSPADSYLAKWIFELAVLKSVLAPQMLRTGSGIPWAGPTDERSRTVARISRGVDV